MKKFTKGSIAILMMGFTALYGCGGPNDDKGTMDQNNSNGEGEIDSSRMIMSDSTSASISVPYHFKQNKKNNLHS